MEILVLLNIKVSVLQYNTIKDLIRTGRLLFAVILPIIRINGLKVNYRNNAMIG